MRFGLKIGLAAALLLSACGGETTEQLKDVDVSVLHSKTLTLDTHIDIPLTYMIEIDPVSYTHLTLPTICSV